MTIGPLPVFALLRAVAMLRYSVLMLLRSAVILPYPVLVPLRWGRRFACPVLLLLSPALAAIDGTVTNRTTGKPQPGATVTLYKLGEAGLESMESVKSDAAGYFTIKTELSGPRLLQSAFDGVTYNHMLPPGAPTTDVKLSVYNAVKQPGESKVTQHMVLFEPSGTELAVSESYGWENAGKTSFYDPKNGIRIYVPAAAVKSLIINATAPQGMPIRRAPEKTSTPDVYSVDFPIKPGESSINLTYTVPFTTPGAFEGKTFYQGGPTSLIAPPGVEVKGDGLESPGIEPRTQAAIFQVKGASYQVEISRAGTLQSPRSGESDQGCELERGSQILP